MTVRHPKKTTPLSRQAQLRLLWLAPFAFVLGGWLFAYGLQVYQAGEATIHLRSGRSFQASANGPEQMAFYLHCFGALILGGALVAGGCVIVWNAWFRRTK